MKKPVHKWKRVACPRCGAPVGSNCFMEPGFYAMIHPQRLTAGDAVVTKVPLQASVSKE